MEITTNNKIILRFYRTTGLMTLSATAAAYLKLPNCIQILENDDFKQIIIGSCEMGEPDSFPIVGKNYSYSNGITIRSTTLIFKIWEANGWDKDVHYLAEGVIDLAQPDIILFDLSKAEKVMRGGVENDNE